MSRFRKSQDAEEEDSKKDRKREELQDIQEKHGHSQQKVREEHGKAGLLHTDEVTMAVLVSQRVQVNDAWDGSSNQPGKSHQSIDAVEKTIEAEIIVVGFSMGQLVVLVVDQVPGDSIVKVAKQESHDGRSSSSKGSPGRNISKVNKPTASSSRFRHI